jgi:5-carboxymethyl-2-hydroxymuconate isomerase
MPHFIVDCSEEILVSHSIDTILKYLHKVASQTELFEEDDIKLRINPFKSYLVGNKKQPFIHVFGHIMEGRSEAEKNLLSNAMVKRLSIMFPNVHYIAMSISEFSAVGYVNFAPSKAEDEPKQDNAEPVPTPDEKASPKAAPPAQ